MARKKKAEYYEQALCARQETKGYYMTRALEAFVNRLEYTCEDVDAGCLDFFDPSYLERCIFFSGSATVWYDPILQSYRCGDVLPRGTWDIYGNPTTWFTQPVNGSPQVELSTDNAVIVYDSSANNRPGTNASYVNPARMCEHIVNDMCDLHTARNVNMSSLAVPLIITGTPGQQLTMQNRLQQIDTGTKYIFVADDTDTGNKIEALHTECVNNIASFSTELDKEWAELLTYLGINNANVFKAERLTDDEVNANNEQLSMKARAVIKARQDAFDKLASMGHPKIKVNWIGGSAALGNGIEEDYTEQDTETEEVKDDGNSDSTTV